MKKLTFGSQIKIKLEKKDKPRKTKLKFEIFDKK